jgi:hypothetical protein
MSEELRRQLEIADDLQLGDFVAHAVHANTPGIVAQRIDHRSRRRRFIIDVVQVGQVTPISSAAVEDFILEYAEGMPMAGVGWGQVRPTNALMAFAVVHAGIRGEYPDAVCCSVPRVKPSRHRSGNGRAKVRRASALSTRANFASATMKKKLDGRPSSCWANCLRFKSSRRIPRPA